MKELAEQAATDAYGSTQRLMIVSEFQAMAAEIDCIANATDFNGIHLLDRSLCDVHDGSNNQSAAAILCQANRMPQMLINLIGA